MCRFSRLHARFLFEYLALHNAHMQHQSTAPAPLPPDHHHRLVLRARRQRAHRFSLSGQGTLVLALAWSVMRPRRCVMRVVTVERVA